MFSYVICISFGDNMYGSNILFEDPLWTVLSGVILLEAAHPSIRRNHSMIEKYLY